MSNNKNLKLKIARLRRQIDDLRHRYHVLNDPEVTDQMYEGLMDELRKIEEKNPELITKDSPTERVAGIPSEKFEKIRHTVTQWSFNDAFNEEDLKNWEERNLKILEKELGSRPKDLDYVCELKIDGLHMVLTYKNGELVTGATRGDGKVGENVTQNIKTVMSLPLKIYPPARGGEKEGVGGEKVDMVVEGEVWMDRKHFDRLNVEREKTGEQKFANPRNAAAGTMRQLDAKIVASRKLDLTLYDISTPVIFSNIPSVILSDSEGSLKKTGRDSSVPQNDILIDTQEHELQSLKKFGFKTDTHWKVCKNIGEILEFYKKWQGLKASQPFWIDGVVVKTNQRKYQDLLGHTGKAPRWAIALKFPAEQGTTKIKDIYVQVGRTGALTPVALMDPVSLAGTTVTHATLHNFDEIKRLGVKIGDMVVVEKAGDIIPKVVRVLDKMRTGKEKTVKMPEICPICGEKVGKREVIDKKQSNSVGYFCTNKNCFAKELKKVIHFVSKKAYNIDGMGKKIVEQLITEGIIKNPADIFTLTKGDLEPLERFAEKSADNLIDAINKSKNISLSKFLFALGIHHVGEESAIDLAKEYGTLEKLMKVEEEELQNLPDIGPQVAKSISEYFSDEGNQKYLEELLSNVKIEDVKNDGKNLKLDGKTFVLTGGLEKLTRDDAKDKIRELGGNISSSISKKTDYCIVGIKPGSKFEKAKKLGVKILDETKLLKLIN